MGAQLGSTQRGLQVWKYSLVEIDDMVYASKLSLKKPCIFDDGSKRKWF